VRAGAAGPLADRFEDGLRFLATAMAVAGDGRSSAAALTAACEALRCFLSILDEAARRHLADPDGEVARLQAQCQALLTLSQAPEEAARHALEAARLARDVAARLMPQLL